MEVSRRHMTAVVAVIDAAVVECALMVAAEIVDSVNFVERCAIIDVAVAAVEHLWKMCSFVLSSIQCFPVLG